MKSTIVVVLMVLIFLALVANLALVAIGGESAVGEQEVRQISFWGLVAANLALAGGGAYFVFRAYKKTEKTTYVWALRGYIANIIVTIVFALAPWFFYDFAVEGFTRAEAMFEIALVLLLFGVPHAVFTYSWYREYLRAVGSRPKRTRKTRKISREEAHLSPDGSGPER